MQGASTLGCLLLPAQEQVGIFAPMNVQGPEPGEGGMVCLPLTTKPGQDPSSRACPLAAECLPKVSVTAPRGCGLMRPSDENIFSP